MKRLWKSCERFIRAEDGPTSVEYAVMLALIIVVCIAAIGTIGSPTSSSLSRVVTDGGFGGAS